MDISRSLYRYESKRSGDEEPLGSSFKSSQNWGDVTGYEACVALDGWTWYLWLGKLFYGILRKEINLLRDRARPNEGPIIPAATLESFSSLHLFLQGIRGCHLFLEHVPYSVLVCNLHDLGPNRQYFFRDSLHCMTVGIRMGGVGVLVALEDGGIATDSYGRYVSEVNGRKLHPLQFDELYAKILYQTSLIEGAIKYVSSKVEDERQLVQTDVIGSVQLNNWSQQDYSQVLRAHVSDWFANEGENKDWFVPPNLVSTSLTDDKGQLLLRPLSDWGGN